MKLTQWLKTAARPPLLWLPAAHTEDTQLLLEQRYTDITAWRVCTARNYSSLLLAACYVMTSSICLSPPGAEKRDGKVFAVNAWLY